MKKIQIGLQVVEKIGEGRNGQVSHLDANGEGGVWVEFNDTPQVVTGGYVSAPGGTKIRAGAKGTGAYFTWEEYK